VLPVGRVIYRLLLTYKLQVTEPGKYKPTVPLLNSTLYECPVESQLLALFDANKRLVYTGACGVGGAAWGRGARHRGLRSPTVLDSLVPWGCVRLFQKTDVNDSTKPPQLPTHPAHPPAHPPPSTR